jgi:two-component system nitrate/nitrite response regulator NarL
MGEALEVVLADDQVIFTDALSEVLRHGGHRVVATATSCRSLAEYVRSFQPDVCITESRFADCDCVDLLCELLAAGPDTRFVVLTGDSSTETMQRALQSGASAVVHKSRRLTALLDVLQRVTGGEVVVEGSFVRPTPIHSKSSQLRRLTAYLTGRELECLALLTQGMDTEAMSRHLGVSPTTVRSHIQAVLTKLGVHSRRDLRAFDARLELDPIASPEGGAARPPLSLARK